MIILKMQLKNWKLNWYHFLISHGAVWNPNVVQQKWYYARYILKQLSHIANLPLKTSTVTSILKVAKINLIFKSGNSDLPEKYRLTIVLLNLSKLIERSAPASSWIFGKQVQLIIYCQCDFPKLHSRKLAATLLSDNTYRKMDDERVFRAV